MKSKNFDCVLMKNTIQEKMYEEIKNLKGSELIEYFRDKAAQSSLADWLRGRTATARIQIPAIRSPDQLLLGNGEAPVAFIEPGLA